MLKAKKITAILLIAVLSLIFTAFTAVQVTKVAAADDVTAITNADDFLYAEGSDNKQVIGVIAPDGGSDLKIVIPEGVTSIGANAFQDVSSRVAEVVLPDSLESIGSTAFAQTRILSIEIPSKVTSIGGHAFDGCSALASVTFKDREADSRLSIGIFAFASCVSIKTIELPADTTVRQYAFNGCTSLLWVYVGNGCRFENTSGTSEATFFPANTQLTIIFSNQTAYEQAMRQNDETFKNNNGSAATYVVKINFYVGASAEPVVYERLHGREYNYVKDDAGAWSIDTAHSTLRVQDGSYSSTTWYGEPAFDTIISYDKVNELLASNAKEIMLYCHETVLAPVFPAEPTSWVYSADKSYDISDKSQVLQALGCQQEFSDAQLAAMNFNVVFANENGDVAQTPDVINANGVYSVSVTLDSAYGSWAQIVNPSVTINVNTSGFNVVLIVFLVLGVIGLAATVSTAIIRKRIQDRNKRRQFTQKEIMDKFRATGGESSIIK